MKPQAKSTFSSSVLTLCDYHWPPSHLVWSRFQNYCALLAIFTPLISPFIYTLPDSFTSLFCSLSTCLYFSHVLPEQFYLCWYISRFLFKIFFHPYIVGYLIVLFLWLVRNQFTIHPVFLSLRCVQSLLLSSFHSIATEPRACCLQKRLCQFPCF